MDVHMMRIIETNAVVQAIEKLGKEFDSLRWNFSPEPSSGCEDLISHWLGEDDEEVMVNVFQGNYINEPFHRQDFFYIHFAWEGSYETLTASHGVRTEIQEGECWIGQPYSGYAARKNSKEACTIIGVLIRRETFIHDFLSFMAVDTAMLNFFLEPQKNRFSDEFIHMAIPAASPVWSLLALMACEYAYKTPDTQKVIKPMAMSLTMYLSAEYRRLHVQSGSDLISRIREYIETETESVTLQSLAAHFGYHPVYLSRYIPQKTGLSFSQIVLEIRMRKAGVLLEHTDLPVEKIAAMTGYSNTSNFYRAFRQYYKTSPRKL